MGIILWAWRRHRTVLYHAKDLINPKLRTIQIELGRLATRLFIRKGQDSRQIASLRYGREVSHRLNSRLTMVSSVKSGIPSLVWRQRRPLTEWLVLVQSSGRSDQIGAYGEVLCSELRQSGLESQWLSFRSRPEPLFWEGRMDRPVRSLA